MKDFPEPPRLLRRTGGPDAALRRSLLESHLDEGPGRDRLGAMAARVATAVGVPIAPGDAAPIAPGDAASTAPGGGWPQGVEPSALGQAAGGAGAGGAVVSFLSSKATYVALVGALLTGGVTAKLVVGSRATPVAAVSVSDASDGRASAGDAPRPHETSAEPGRVPGASVAVPDVESSGELARPDAPPRATRLTPATPSPGASSGGDGAERAPAETEAQLLHRAQDAVGRDPRAALALCAEHQRRFPGGLLGQERDVIAINALVHLGRGGEAKARGRRFLKAYPHSAHRGRVRELVGEGGSDEAR